ncbi:hypothetical protein BVRB_7g176660 [Beta vulgaris subsp. vulgaris]|nr:hypothetical protein BVRB_7g176660 [Beta vulgaris subsp. vulgaris]
MNASTCDVCLIEIMGMVLCVQCSKEGVLFSIVATITEIYATDEAHDFPVAWGVLYSGVYS